MEDFEYSLTNREKSRKVATGYNVCYDCEGRRPGGCKDCNRGKEHGKVMKAEGKAKKRDMYNG